MRLQIRYRSGDGVTTERVISDIVVEPPKMLDAFCEMRGERRSFAVDRIDSAADADTGEVIDDVGLHFGLASTKKPIPVIPVFSGHPTPMATADAQNQRKKDKSALFNRFSFPVIVEIAKRQLFSLFDDRCFKCGASSDLHLDHHVPQYLGGRLIPGNVVILCARCNAAKHDLSPSEFYTGDQLAALEPLLRAQLQIFDFEIDWSRWMDAGQRAEYLASLGASPELLKEAMNNKESPFYSWQDCEIRR